MLAPMNKCESCGNPFVPKKNSGGRFCSMKCYGKSIRSRMPPTEQRIMSRVEKDTSTGCWVWTGGKNGWGYGYINIEGKMKRVHKVMWELLHPKVTKGLELDHLCRNRACCNPSHLEVVTRAENLRRGVWPDGRSKKKTHCPQGHEYTEENTYRGKVKSSGRHCRACMRARIRRPEQKAYDRARYLKQKEIANAL